MRPKIWLGLLSLTRFRVTACALGCTKLILAALPKLKLSQLMTARWLLWLTVMAAAWAVAVWVMVALPRATLPPVGNWLATGVGGDCAPTPPVRARPSTTVANTPPLADLTERWPAALAVSGTACQHWADSDQRVLCTRFMGCLKKRSWPSARRGLTAKCRRCRCHCFGGRGCRPNAGPRWL